MKEKVEEILSLIPNITEEDINLIKKAYKFSEKAHSGQIRKSGEPYIIHPLNTAKILASQGMAPVVVTSGLLHDIFEETRVTKDELKKEFGDEIFGLVEGAKKLGDIRYTGTERSVENLRKFFISEAKDLRILVIRLADRLHNVETLEHVDKEKQSRIAMETLEVYAPLANRLSMGQLKGDLEDAAFRFAYPIEYEKIKKLLGEKTDVKEKYLIETKNRIEELIKEFGIENFRMDYRQKHLYSLWNKIKKYDIDISNIYDIIAIRVIVPSVEDCYSLLGLIHGEWKPMLNRIRDYIANPKVNGYQSLHTIIFTEEGGVVEVQIRTFDMHHRAENGVAAHFAYKEKGSSEKTMAKSKDTEWARELHELNQNKDDKEKFKQTIKLDFFKDRIFVFTPRGDIIDLPEGSCVVDFAYAIHTSIGDHVQGAKINGKNSSLDTKLKTNDVVEIQTNKNGRPSSKWLDFAKTNLAKKHINNYLREHSLLSKFLSFGK